MCSKYGRKYFWLGTEITSTPAPVPNKRSGPGVHFQNWIPLQPIAGHDSPGLNTAGGWLHSSTGSGILLQSTASALLDSPLKSYLGATSGANQPLEADYGACKLPITLTWENENFET